MNTEILGVIAQIVLMVVLAYPIGKYISKVFKGEKVWSDFMTPIEKIMYKLGGVDPTEEMNWKQFLKALLVINLFWFFWGMILFSGSTAPKSRRQFRTVCSSGIQHMYQLPREL